MRKLMGAIAACAIAALAPVAAPAADPGANCANLLTSYAQTARAFPEWRSNGRGIDRNTSRAAQRVIQAGCVTRESDLAGLAALTSELRGQLRGEHGAAIAPTWLQAGVVPGLIAENQARTFFAALGYGTRGEGAPGLGRWVLVGPFATQGGLSEAAAIARRAGFKAPLPRS